MTEDATIKAAFLANGHYSLRLRTVDGNGENENQVGEFNIRISAPDNRMTARTVTHNNFTRTQPWDVTVPNGGSTTVTFNVTLTDTSIASAYYTLGESAAENALTVDTASSTQTLEVPVTNDDVTVTLVLNETPLGYQLLTGLKLGNVGSMFESLDQIKRSVEQSLSVPYVIGTAIPNPALADSDVFFENVKKLNDNDSPTAMTGNGRTTDLWFQNLAELLTKSDQNTPLKITNTSMVESAIDREITAAIEQKIDEYTREFNPDVPIPEELKAQVIEKITNEVLTPQVRTLLSTPGVGDGQSHNNVTAVWDGGEIVVTISDATRNALKETFSSQIGYSYFDEEAGNWVEGLPELEIFMQGAYEKDDDGADKDGSTKADGSARENVVYLSGQIKPFTVQVYSNAAAQTISVQINGSLRYKLVDDAGNTFTLAEALAGVTQDLPSAVIPFNESREITIPQMQPVTQTVNRSVDISELLNVDRLNNLNEFVAKYERRLGNVYYLDGTARTDEPDRFGRLYNPDSAALNALHNVYDPSESLYPPTGDSNALVYVKVKGAQAANPMYDTDENGEPDDKSIYYMKFAEGVIQSVNFMVDGKSTPLIELLPDGSLRLDLTSSKWDSFIDEAVDRVDTLRKETSRVVDERDGNFADSIARGLKRTIQGNQVFEFDDTTTPELLGALFGQNNQSEFTMRQVWKALKKDSSVKEIIVKASLDSVFGTSDPDDDSATGEATDQLKSVVESLLGGTDLTFQFTIKKID